MALKAIYKIGIFVKSNAHSEIHHEKNCDHSSSIMLNFKAFKGSMDAD